MTKGLTETFIVIAKGIDPKTGLPIQVVRITPTDTTYDLHELVNFDPLALDGVQVGSMDRAKEIANFLKVRAILKDKRPFQNGQNVETFESDLRPMELVMHFHAATQNEPSLIERAVTYLRGFIPKRSAASPQTP